MPIPGTSLNAVTAMSSKSKSRCRRFNLIFILSLLFNFSFPFFDVTSASLFSHHHRFAIIAVPSASLFSHHHRFAIIAVPSASLFSHHHRFAIIFVPSSSLFRPHRRFRNRLCLLRCRLQIIQEPLHVIVDDQLIGKVHFFEQRHNVVILRNHR